MKKLPLIASVLLLAALSASAQEKEPSWLVRTEDIAENNYLRTKVSTQGVFYDLTVEGKVQVRF